MIRSCRGCCLVLLAGSFPLRAAEPKTLWLVVAASSKTLPPAMAVTVKLRPSSPEAGIVASSDCENLAQGLYLSVAAIAGDRAGAQASLAKAKMVSTDAYVRDCRPKPDSRILLGVPAVDPSIEKIPLRAVNWTDEDRISTVIKLAEGGFLWIRRIYEPAPEDPLEGRRTLVRFFRTGPRESIQLGASCTDPSVSDKAGRIALCCARETAGENLLHETRVYDKDSGKELMNVPRCRNAKMISGSELTCQAEEVDREGSLHLRAKRVKLP